MAARKALDIDLKGSEPGVAVGQGVFSVLKKPKEFSFSTRRLRDLFAASPVASPLPCATAES